MGYSPQFDALRARRRCCRVKKISLVYTLSSPSWPLIAQQVAHLLAVPNSCSIAYNIQQTVCVCHPIYSGRQACGRISRGHTGGSSHSISPPSICGACLNFYRLNFYREKDSAIPLPLVDREVEFCVLTKNCSPLVGLFFFSE